MDLDELLSYFLSGSFFIAVVAIGRPDSALAVIAVLDPLNGTALASVAYVVVLSSAALILGHAFSIIVRNMERKLLNVILGDPEFFILEGSSPKSIGSNSFYTDQLKKTFASEFEKTFGWKIGDDTKTAMPRLVRSYVFHRSESARAIRDRLVRVRSFCANMGISCILASVANIFTLSAVGHAILWGAALMLIIKQRSLDERESKEIYMYFMAL